MVSNGLNASIGKVSYLTIWSQGQDLSFWDDKLGRKSYASLLDDNFNESELERKKKVLISNEIFRASI